jgi:hypothetical protein
VKRITSDGFSLPHGREPLGNIRIGTGWVCDRKEQAKENAMGHQVQAHQVQATQVQAWRSGDGEKLWLSALIDTMEKIARRELRAVPCDRLVLAKVSAHLARPVSPYPLGASHFSLRN